MKTFSEWKESGLRLYQFIDADETIDREMFEYFLNTFPPKFVSLDGDTFLSGEADCFDKRGMLYYAFSKIDCDEVYEAFFYNGLMSVDDIESSPYDQDDLYEESSYDAFNEHQRSCLAFSLTYI